MEAVKGAKGMDHSDCPEYSEFVFFYPWQVQHDPTHRGNHVAASVAAHMCGAAWITAEEVSAHDSW